MFGLGLFWIPAFAGMTERGRDDGTVAAPFPLDAAPPYAYGPRRLPRSIVFKMNNLVVVSWRAWA